VNLLSLVLNIVYVTRDRLGPVGVQCRFMQPAQGDKDLVMHGAQDVCLTHAAISGWHGLHTWWPC
jgi:hypothetical protein